MTVTAEIQALKDAHRKTWASGDYPRCAELVTDVGERIVERAGVKLGSEVLDVAAGTGNASIPAARAGAHRHRVPRPRPTGAASSALRSCSPTTRCS